MASSCAQEKRFTIQCDNGVELSWTNGPDQARIAPGEVEIIDYKTGKPKLETNAQKDLQLKHLCPGGLVTCIIEVTPVRLIYYNLQNNQCVSASRGGIPSFEKVAASAPIQEVAADIRARDFFRRARASFANIANSASCAQHTNLDCCGLRRAKMRKLRRSFLSPLKKN